MWINITIFPLIVNYIKNTAYKDIHRTGDCEIFNKKSNETCDFLFSFGHILRRIFILIYNAMRKKKIRKKQKSFSIDVRKLIIYLYRKKFEIHRKYHLSHHV